ncbi:hypothetical protein PM082_022220 [Marasmius tenuissimus]|nr:hypothetical protein PM082_022220 [Marasmius tenuissimus]
MDNRDCHENSSGPGRHMTQPIPEDARRSRYSLVDSTGIRQSGSPDSYNSPNPQTKPNDLQFALGQDTNDDNNEDMLDDSDFDDPAADAAYNTLM